jgi:hypothetical protein
MGVAPEPAPAAWAALTDALGFTVPGVGGRVEAAAGVPPLAGSVEHVGPAEYPEVLLRLDQPAPGLAHLFAMPMGGQVYLSLRFFLYGDGAAAAVARAEPAWQAWIAERFPFVGEASEAAPAAS